MVGTKFKNSLVGGLFLGLASMLILTSPALAVETKWTGLQDGNDWIDTEELDKRCACPEMM